MARRRRRPGRPKTVKGRVKVSLHLSKEDLSRLDRACKRAGAQLGRDVSRSELVRGVLRGVPLVRDGAQFLDQEVI